MEPTPDVVHECAQLLTELALAGEITFDEAIQLAAKWALSTPPDPLYLAEPGFFIARPEGPLEKGVEEPEPINPLHEWRGAGTPTRHEEQ